MKKIYDYFYFRCYDLLETQGRFNLPFLSVSLYSLLLTHIVVAFMPFLTGRTPMFFIVFPGTYVVAMVANYFLFVRKRKYRKIVMSFRPEPRWKKIAGRVGVFLYISLMLAIIINNQNILFNKAAR